MRIEPAEWTRIVEFTARLILDFTVWVPEPGCCLWKGRMQNGYPTWRRDGRTFAVHRAAWSVFNGRQPGDDYVVRHLCHNRACLAPWHLAIGDHEDNARDNATNPRWQRHLASVGTRP